MEEIPQSYILAGLAGSLLLLNLGPMGVIKLLLLAVLLLLAGFLAFLLALYGSCRLDSSIHWSRVQINRSSSGFLSWKPITSRRSQRSNAMELTGSQSVDRPVQEMIDFILRDFIYSWYSKLSSNPDFPLEVKSCLARVTSILSERIREVDWVNHMTTHLVDDVASHLRLYKSARNKFRAPFKDGEARPADLESLFFDSEVEMEETICRDSVCTESEQEAQYFQDLTDLLLYLLLPQSEFDAGPVRSLVREVLSRSLLQPVVHSLSDPDNINQTLVWLLRDFEIKTDTFIATLRHSDSLAELEATRGCVNKEISLLRSHDSCPDDLEDSKNQLNSLLYLKKVLDNKISRLQSGFSSNSYGLPANIDWSSKISSSAKLFNLPLEVILKNNLALSYFMDYMSSVGSLNFVFFLLNIEGWKVSTEQQLEAIQVEALKREQGLLPEPSSQGSAQEKETACYSSLKEAAQSIYQEYLSDKATPKIVIDDAVNKRLLFKIRTEAPDPTWFDEVAGEICNQLEVEEKYLINFKRSVGYLKLLAELDLLKVEHYEDDDEGSVESASESLSLGSVETVSGKSLGTEAGAYSGSDSELGGPKVYEPYAQTDDFGQRLKIKPGKLAAEIVDVEMGRETNGKQFAMYKINVNKSGNVWDVLRRYSDFHHFYMEVTCQFSALEKIAFPGKKTFGNLERNVVEKRQKMLNTFLQQVIQKGGGTGYPGLTEQVTAFLLPNWEIARPGSVVGRAVNAVSHDIQRSVKTVSTAVTSVPASIGRNLDNMVDGITKAFISKDVSARDVISNAKVGSCIEDTSENIPLRITLLLLDEVFDLADRNMWLRRQIIAVLRQIINHMFGDIVNKKIVDYFTTLTSEEAVAGYLSAIKDSVWPEGRLADEKPKREETSKQMCRVSARAALISALPEELRRVIGSETSRVGLVNLFDMLQYTTLNRRLAIVLLEGIVSTLFPQHKFQEMLCKLHSRSSRTRNDLKNSQRTKSDLRHRREKSK